MAEQHTYCVFFHPQALDVLGEAITPYLTDGPHGKFLQCNEIDTGGAFCEMEIIGTSADGKPVEVELMVPTGMIRLVISTAAAEIDFGFA
jgi:hypothetical protein